MPVQPWFKLYLVLLLPAIVTFASPATHLQAASSHKAFFPGEKLKFRLKWGLIPAGEALLEILPIEIIDGIESYHFVMTVRTNAFIDAFYKYRSRIDAYADTGLTRSIRYRKTVEARKKIREVVVNFDWDKSEVRYHSVKKYTDDAVKTSVKMHHKGKSRIRKRLIPVKIKSKIVIGSFTGELISFTGGQNNTQ